MGVRRSGDQVELQVQDYGPGIAEADLPNLFARFYQGERTVPLPYPGLGLGLYITRELVRAHGGSIDVSSAPGRGTLFTVRLPLLQVLDADARADTPADA